GTPPAELVAAGRDEVTRYGGEIVAGRVEAAAREATGFVVTLDGGREVRARRLLVATGLVDELPDLPGLAERWGRDVLHCPYCHGWEVRDRRIGVLATGPTAVHQAELWRQWSPHVLLLLHDATLAAEDVERLAAREITVVADRVAAVEVTDDTLTGVRLASGEVVALDAVVVAPRFTARAEVLESLGCKPVDVEFGGPVIGSQVPADPTGATAVPGVWVAGNVADVRAQVVASAAAGLAAGAAVNADLVAEEGRAAVDAYRERTRTMFEEAAWEERYRARPAVWSGRPNPQLVAEATGLPAGRALDVGCGEGADAGWLAGRGWRVTAVDISATALERAAAHAAAAGPEVADRIEWLHADLRVTPPAEGAYDLVSAQFMHLPGAARRELVARLAAAVAPGGTLLI
ncbi:methyltransferase domain-containing protein, partial [Micromonospora sp. DH15]|nr:methyltransferase domain-containing protein [Micromonospora sp. DH15]